MRGAVVDYAESEAPIARAHRRRDRQLLQRGRRGDRRREIAHVLGQAPDGDCLPPTSGSACVSPCCRWADLEQEAAIVGGRGPRRPGEPGRGVRAHGCRDHVKERPAVRQPDRRHHGSGDAPDRAKRSRWSSSERPPRKRSRTRFQADIPHDLRGGSVAQQLRHGAFAPLQVARVVDLTVPASRRRLRRARGRPISARAPHASGVRASRWPGRRCGTGVRARAGKELRAPSPAPAAGW